jgi:outer membrane lipoprotein-sorting protein
VLCLLSFVACVSSPAFALPTTDELLKSITDKATSVKTMQADTASTTMTPAGDMKGAGQVFTAKSEVAGKTVQKMLMTLKSTMQAEDATMTTDVKIVNDGQFIWQEMRMTVPRPMVQVVKSKVGQAGGIMSAGAVTDGPDQLKKQFNFTAVSEDAIDGRKMYVLEGTMKAAAPQGVPISKVKYCFDEESLMLRRMVALDKADKEVTRFDLTNVKVNEELDPKMFDYAPPPGARIIDRTNN